MNYPGKWPIPWRKIRKPEAISCTVLNIAHIQSAKDEKMSLQWELAFAADHSLLESQSGSTKKLTN